NLKKIPQPIWDMMKINGHIYGVPRPRALVRSAVIIRKDWLDKLGLPIPKTVDDFKKVAVAFAKNDPDGDGKPDTYGLVTGSKLDNLAPVFYALGAGNGWVKQSDGTLMNSNIAQGTKDTLQWVRDLYTQGVLNKDFPTMQGTQDWQDLESGKAGMIFGQTSDYSRYVQNLKKVDPNGQLIMIAPPVGPTGISGLEGTTGFFGDFVIPAKEDPAKAKKVMDLLDYEASDEGYHLSQYGVDGVDNTKNADGSYQVNDKFIKENVGNVEPMNPYDPYSYVDKTAPLDVQKAQHDNLDLVKDKGIYNPAAAFTAPTYVQKGVDLDNMKWDYFIKIATGQLPMSAFDEFVSKWKAGGGDQITKETNDWYKTQGNK
ncbi:MAG: putative aldouronate transport system substrate-binding protein, partial [Bacilli bacterium]|nr:putative aldouronate transport system substrate-binding protein [Bacilli bacterium]